MTPSKRMNSLGAWLLTALASVPMAAGAQAAAPAASAVSATDDSMHKQQMQALGVQYKTASQLYEALRSRYGGTPFKAPDWSGVWTRGKGGLQFDPDLPGDSLPVSAKLTPPAAQRVQEKVRMLTQVGGEYDPISDCRPPGVPRWFSEPFLKEFVPTRDQTWFMNEMVNDVRRIYTDGRAHTPDGDAVPSWNGDSVGFWSGDTLFAYTSQLMKGQFQRGVQPDYSDKVEVVERWHKVDDRNIHVDLWVFDPVNLVEPWFTRQIYTRLTNADKSLRIRYWDCHENDNNQIMVRDDGTSQFKNFNFVKDNAAASSDPAVKAAAQGKAASQPAAAR